MGGGELGWEVDAVGALYTELRAELLQPDLRSPCL